MKIVKKAIAFIIKHEEKITKMSNLGLQVGRWIYLILRFTMMQ